MMRLTLTLVAHSNKAVAVGAVLFHVDHFVTRRIAKFTYGTQYRIIYQPFDPEHVKREWRSLLDAAGDKRTLTISKPCYHGFAIHLLLSILLNNLIALQGTRVLEDREIRQPLIYVTRGAPQRQVVSPVIKYTGTLRAPQWMDIEQGSVLSFQHLCEGHSRQE